MARHDLATPDAWVEMRDYRELRSRDRKLVMAAMFGKVDFADAELTLARPTAGGLYSATVDAAEVAASLLITSWNIPYLVDVPPTLDAIGDLKIEDADALAELASPAVSALLPSRPSVAQAGKPNTPTQPVRG